MPAERIALEMLEECGPLAVSSANLTGRAAAIDVHGAREMLRDSVAVYLDGGPSTHGVASTIVDAGQRRVGVVGLEQLAQHVAQTLPRHGAVAQHADRAGSADEAGGVDDGRGDAVRGGRRRAARRARRRRPRAGRSRARRPCAGPMKFYVLTVVLTAVATLALTWVVWRIGMRYRLQMIEK
jgi:hypothetical protein